jgi:hypothetical protein
MLSGIFPIYKDNGNSIDVVLLDLNMPVERGSVTFKKNPRNQSGCQGNPCYREH